MIARGALVIDQALSGKNAQRNWEYRIVKEVDHISGCSLHSTQYQTSRLVQRLRRRQSGAGAGTYELLPDELELKQSDAALVFLITVPDITKSRARG